MLTEALLRIFGGQADSGAGDGQFAYNLMFTLPNALLPQNGKIIALLFYNGTTIAKATAYKAASDVDWTWTNLTSFLNLPLNFSLSDQNVTWLNDNEGYTGTSLISEVPELDAERLMPVGIIGLISHLDAASHP